MIKKDRLLKRLDDVIKLEERLIPLLNRHVSSSIAFSGLDEKEQQQIVGRLQKTALSGTKHIEVLKGIRDEVTKGKVNVY